MFIYFYVNNKNPPSNCPTLSLGVMDLSNLILYYPMIHPQKLSCCSQMVNIIRFCIKANTFKINSYVSFFERRCSHIFIQFKTHLLIDVLYQVYLHWVQWFGIGSQKSERFIDGRGGRPDGRLTKTWQEKLIWLHFSHWLLSIFSIYNYVKKDSLLILTPSFFLDHDLINFAIIPPDNA